MYCRNCGIKNADEAPTCISCGHPLTPVNPFQPGVAATGTPLDGKPVNYLVQAILVTLCCCLPLGIVAIVYAAQVDSKWNGGDHHGASTAAENAKKWTWIAFGLGILAQGFFIGIQVFAAIDAANAGGGGF
jgi:hypothetical protein